MEVLLRPWRRWWRMRRRRMQAARCCRQRHRRRGAWGLQLMSVPSHTEFVRLLQPIDHLNPGNVVSLAPRAVLSINTCRTHPAECSVVALPP